MEKWVVIYIHSNKIMGKDHRKMTVCFYIMYVS